MIKRNSGGFKVALVTTLFWWLAFSALVNYCYMTGRLDGAFFSPASEQSERQAMLPQNIDDYLAIQRKG